MHQISKIVATSIPGLLAAATACSGQFSTSASGFVGLGTATPAAGLHINTSPSWSGHNYGAALLIDGTRNNAIGLLDSNSENPFAIANLGHGLGFASMPALDDVTTAPVVQLYLNRNGNVGVGTTSPVANLEVIGTVRLGPTHVSGGDLSLDSSRALRGKQIFVQSEGGLYLNALEGGGTVHVGGWEGSVSSIAVSGSAAIKGAIELGESSSAGINGAFIDFHGGFGRSSEDFNVRLANDADRSLSLHGGSLVVGEGEITTRALNITGGSDLAWRFKVSDAKGLSSSSQEHTIPQPGMLVSIDRSADGRLQVSHGAYDSAVAGVISGAGDIHVGMTMGQSGSMADGDTPVTSTGRVWVWADATYGAISRGDRLTSSETPGHAMKVADRERGDGTSIGKAMSELKSGKGLVLVWMSMN